MIISRGRIAGLSEATLARFITRVGRAIPLRGFVNVLVTTSNEMKQLNDRFRGKNEATDVLSFPSGGARGFAGEIAISLEIARQNAEALGHSTAAEIKILVLHGMLHLAGFDHETDDGKMARKEQYFRRTLNLPASLIERSEAGLRALRYPRTSATILATSSSGARPRSRAEPKL